ncbi:MAG: CHAD domain-containing protein, partial [Steroidobacteraceae bacterium]
SVHALRVAARQARALLWSAKPWLIRRHYESCLTHLKWLSSGLGPLRDIDVTARLLLYPIARHAQLSSAQRHTLAILIARARRELRQTLWGRQGGAGAAAHTRMVCRLLRSPQLLRRSAPDALAPWRRRILHAVRRCERRLRKARTSELHKLRIRTKHCRYALEALGERAPAAAVLELRRMQRALGRYVDLQLAAAWCETRAAGELDRKLRRRIRRSARSLARRQARAICSARNP